MLPHESEFARRLGLVANPVEPTEDEAEMVSWWNALDEQMRRCWLNLAKSARPVDAWAEHKRHCWFNVTDPTRYEISPRPAELGGGWTLELFERGQEVGGDMFSEYDHALSVACVWMASLDHDD
jgi:hypothetical protein